jgi:type I restriction enzyme R subunit
VEEELRDKACKPVDSAALRNLIKAVKQKADIVIDEGTVDEVTSAGYDLKQAELRTTSFREFIEKNKSELLALEILYSKPYPKRRLTYASIRELAQRLTDPPYHLTTADVWQAYRRLEASLVRGAPSDKVLTDIISLVQFATGQSDILEPYAARVSESASWWSATVNLS